MSSYIKLNDSWIEVFDVYKKENGTWVLQTDINSSIVSSGVYIYNEVKIDGEITYLISGENSYTGKTFNLTYIYNNRIVTPTWSIISGGQYATINSNGKVTIEQGVINETIVIQAVFKNRTTTKTISITYDNQLSIECANTITGTSGNAICRFNSTTVNPTWTLTAGNGIASIDNRGNITFNDSGTIIIEVEYHNYIATKQVELIYEAGTTTETSIDENGNITTETTSTSTDDETGAITTTTTTITTNEDGSTSSVSSEIIENQDGSSTSTITTINSDGTSTESTSTVSAPDPETGVVTTEETINTTNPDGTTSETTSTTVENQDGSSQTSSSTTNYDEAGNETGSTNIEVTNNADGSSSSSTTNYNENGDPIDQFNQSEDADGNVSKQNVSYDSNGDPVVTGYDIDTSSNEDGVLIINNNEGINTDYYAFDMTHGFEMVLHFTIDFNNQPTGQSDGHNNIMAMKRQSPEPWYGFQIRRSSGKSFIQLGTQFNTGANNNITINTTTDNKYNGSNSVYEYNIRIIYDPTKSTNKFVLDELISDYHISYNNYFPDLEELKYIKLTLGYALDKNGDPFRFSNINIFNFYIKKLHNIDNPVISFSNGNTITITCATQEATIYYKLNNTGNYLEYTQPIIIHEDVYIETYSQLEEEKSEIISNSFIYDNGIAEPVIDTVNNKIVLTCETQGVTIYYRLNQSGSYIVYSGAIEIEEDTVIQTYAELNGEISDIVSSTCLFYNGVESPVISTDGEFVTITCAQQNTEIYYRLNQTGEFLIYTSAIQLFDDTIVEAYAKVGNTVGHTVIENCIYDPIILDNPVITSNGPTVLITCSTSGASIYYKLNNTGNYILYTEPIAISEDTDVQAYSTLRGKMSSLISQTCIYSNVHDYSLDYLTFRILTSGVLVWKQNGSFSNKTIEYSINHGAWTSITSNNTNNLGATINVSANDVVRFRGTNTKYAEDKNNYIGFGSGQYGSNETYPSGAAEFNVEGNIMSLIYGDNFINQTSFPNGTTYNLCSLFKKAKCISAENLILTATTLTQYCYRAMFSWCIYLEKAPQILATTLAKGACWYMFESCAITEAPDLLAETLVAECYGNMFTGCSSLNYVKCMAIAGFNTPSCKTNWLNGVASSGTFVKDSGITVNQWSSGASGIPTNWLVYDDVPVAPPTITYDGFSTITLSCETQGATIYYRLNNTENYSTYSTDLTISEDTVIQTYSEFSGQESRIISQTCVYVSNIPLESSNRNIKYWQYNNQEIETPYSVNAIDGHSSNYAKGTFNFESSFALRTVQPTHLWFQHADQSAVIYINETQVTKHWGGYTSFGIDISNYVQAGNNTVKVALKNNEGNNLAPANADFNFNATLGNVKLLTSPCIPSVNYGYDGFHIFATVNSSSATINIKTTVASGASVVCTITDDNYTWTDTQVSDGTEMTFTTTITGNDLHLWNGKLNPYLYNITLEISKDNVLYHRFTRPYGFRYYDYVINDTTILPNEDPYTGFLLNGQPYLLRGCCMHDDIEGKANALNEDDYDQTFNIIQELGCNFLRLAHYPHPKEVYDRCDELGIIVQTEGPCVNKMQSTMPADYFTHLEGQYTDMVNEHMNHPCIIFWGLSNETQTGDTKDGDIVVINGKDFAKTKAELYSSIIKGIHPEAWVGYVVSQSATNPSAHYNNPNLDWFGCNIYVGWYASPNSNNPSSEINKRIANTITALGKILAYSEYGCGGTPVCHSDDPLTTTTRGNNARHDIEYQMWLHEGQIAAIKNYPELAFTSQWQLFDIAVSNRNEGYTVCLDGETVTIDESLRRLNNKGLVERDHIHKKDTFYLYKAWWNPTPFIHICGKNYTKKTDRVIKCYTNFDTTDSLSLYVNDTFVETVNPSNYIAQFTAYTFTEGDEIKVSCGNIEDSFIIL